MVTATRRKKKDDQAIDFDRLAYAMTRSRWVLRKFREERREAVRQYVGLHWSEEGAYKEVPVNLLSLYVSVVGRALVAKNPRLMLSTFDTQNKPAVSAMQTWANKEIVRMKVANVLQRVVLDALFSIGVCKVALATPADSAGVAWTLPAGSPFVERVDLDDFVFDVHARDFSEVSYIGHRFRCPLAAVRDSKLYSKARLRLTASQDSFYNLEGDERISTLGRGFYAGDDEEFEDMVDLWEVYLPRHRLVVTMVDDELSTPDTSHYPEPKPHDRNGGALRVQRWLGPDHGPYHILRYMVVPGNCMSKAPIQDLVDLHGAVNNIYRKLIRQSERMKKQMLFQGGDEDARRLQDGSDGEWVRCDNPQATQERAAGGPDQAIFQLGVHLNEVFNRLAGNLDLMGGLAPQSKTLGQDTMLSQNASAGISSMQETTVDYVSDVLKSLCWYWWHDPFKVMRSKLQLPGIPGMGITRQVTPAQRMRSRWDDLEIECDPYSLQHQTPQQVMTALNQVVTQVITPMMPLLQQQGVQFDVNTYLKKIAAYMNLPDLPEICTIGEPPQQESPTPPQSTGKPGQTSREYVRRSIGAGTNANQGAELVNNLARNIGRQQNQNGAGR